MRRLEIDTGEPHEISTAETHFGIVLVLAAFAIAANVCSGIITLVVTP
jgi:hypothetical protein